MWVKQSDGTSSFRENTCTTVRCGTRSDFVGVEPSRLRYGRPLSRRRRRRKETCNFSQGRKGPHFSLYKRCRGEREDSLFSFSAPSTIPPIVVWVALSGFPVVYSSHSVGELFFGNLFFLTRKSCLLTSSEGNQFIGRRTLLTSCRSSNTFLIARRCLF